MEKYFHFDRYKTLQELEGRDWGEPTFNSHLVATCHNLRNKPVGNFNVQDLRIMIVQNISLDYLIPLALEMLEDNIFLEGDTYSCNLLDAVLKVGRAFWLNNPIYKNDLEGIIEKNIKDLENKLDLFLHQTV